MSSLVDAPEGDRAHIAARRYLVMAFASGLALSIMTSGGLAGERLSKGSPAVPIVAYALVSLASIAFLAAFGRARGKMSLGASVDSARADGHRLRLLGLVGSQLAGVCFGVVAVHACLRSEVTTHPWLTESLAQMVNDGVAVSAAVTVIWAAAEELNVSLLACALFIMTAYRATGRWWHVDHPVQEFTTTVSDLVVAEFIAAATVALVWRHARVPRS
jgi:hypothetical protein